MTPFVLIFAILATDQVGVFNVIKPGDNPTFFADLPACMKVLAEKRDVLTSHNVALVYEADDSVGLMSPSYGPMVLKCTPYEGEIKEAFPSKEA